MGAGPLHDAPRQSTSPIEKQTALFWYLVHAPMPTHSQREKTSHTPPPSAARAALYPSHIKVKDRRRDAVAPCRAYAG